MALGPLQLNIIDLGGSILLRRTWNTYLKATDLNAIIFVIDASDETRFAEAKQVLHVYFKLTRLIYLEIIIEHHSKSKMSRISGI